MASRKEGYTLKTMSSIALREKCARLMEERNINRQKIKDQQSRIERMKVRHKEDLEAKLATQKELYDANIKDIRLRRDRRLSKYSLKVFRRDQQIYMMRKAFKRRQPTIKKVKFRKRDVAAEARKKGFEQGLQKSVKIRKRDIYKDGFKAGYEAARNRIEKERGGLIYRSGSVDSIARCSVMVSRLSTLLQLAPEFIAIILLAGQYEAFFFEDLKSSFEQIEGDLFYRRIWQLKYRGYMHKLGTKNRRNIWGLTPLGVELHKRMTAYISRNIKEKLTN